MSEKPDESIQAAFGKRRELYVFMLKHFEIVQDRIAHSQWQDEKARLGVAASFAALTSLVNQLASLDALSEKMMNYMDASQRMFTDLYPLVRDIAGEVERIGGNQERLEKTKTELEEIRQSIADQTKTYGELQKLVAGAVQGIEEDRKKVEKGLSYVA